MSDDVTVRPFAAVLQDLAKGRVHAELSEKLAELTREVLACGKKGTLTLTVTVDLVGKGGETLAVSARVDAKPPRTTPPATVFFSDRVGNLSRNDPNQPTLPLRLTNDENRKAANA